MILSEEIIKIKRCMGLLKESKDKLLWLKRRVGVIDDLLNDPQSVIELDCGKCFWGLHAYYEDFEKGVYYKLHEIPGQLYVTYDDEISDEDNEEILNGDDFDDELYQMSNKRQQVYGYLEKKYEKKIHDFFHSFCEKCKE